MRLYEFSVTRSIRCRWMLRELDVPFESVQVDLSRGEHRARDYLRVHPQARVPVLDDDGFLLHQSTAICTYLGDKFPEKGLVPPAGTQERALYDQWLFFCASELDAPLWVIRRHLVLYPEERRCAAILPVARDELREAVAVLDGHLSRESFVVGGRFSAADIVVGHTLAWASFFPRERSLELVDGHPHIASYLDRVLARPACPAELVEIAEAAKAGDAARS